MKGYRKGLLICLILLCLAGAGITARAEDARPAPYDRVILLGVDGVGTFFRNTDTPNFDRIFADGNVTWNARTVVPSNTAPGWCAMFYGIPYGIHRVSNEQAALSPHYDPQFPSVFAQTRKAYPECEIASFITGCMNYGMIDLGPDEMVQEPAGKRDVTDETTVEKAIRWLDEHDPKLCLIYQAEADGIGHTARFESEAYYEAVRRADERLGRIYDALERRGLLENTLLLCVTDHGGKDYNHGGGSEEELACVFAARGPGIQTDTEIGEMELQDIAAIIRYALGLETPEGVTSRVPAGFFAGVGGAERPRSLIPEETAFFRTHESVPAPEMNLSAELAEKLIYRKTMDGNREDLKGTRKLQPGYFGNGLQTHRTYIKTKIKFDERWQGLSFCLWLREADSIGDPVLVAAKNWKRGEHRGFCLALDGVKLRLNAGNGRNEQRNLYTYMPDDFEKGWTHVLVSIDEDGKAAVYTDFRRAVTGQLVPEGDSLADWLGGQVFTAGEDVNGNYKFRLRAIIDDVMIFNAPLTDGEVDELKEYYLTGFQPET